MRQTLPPCTGGKGFLEATRSLRMPFMPISFVPGIYGLPDIARHVE